MYICYCCTIHLAQIKKKGAARALHMQENIYLRSLLLLQYDQSANESRLKSMTTNPNSDISQLPQLRQIYLLSSHLAASDRQGEEELVICLLMADLDPRPLSNLRELSTFHQSKKNARQRCHVPAQSGEIGIQSQRKLPQFPSFGLDEDSQHWWTDGGTLLV